MGDEIKKDTFQAFFECSADAILIIIGDKFVDCNTATLELLLYENKEDLLNVHPSQISPEYQSDGLLSFEKANEMMTIAVNEGANRFEWEHQRSNGEIFPAEVLLTAVIENEQPAIHAVIREITVRKTIETQLRRLTSIIESTTDMASTATPDGKIEYINQAGLSMLGWQQSDLSGKKISEAHPNSVLDIIKKGISIAEQEGTWVGETALKGADGSDIPVSQVIMAHKNSCGELEYLSTIIRDISARKEAEDNLQQNLDYLHSIIDNQPTCITLVSADGTLLEMNPAGLDMFAASSKQEIIGINMNTLIDEADSEIFKQFYEKVCAGDKGTLEFKIKALDGKIHQMESTAVPLQQGKNGEIVQLGITRDVTQELASQEEKIQLESQLRQGQKMETIGTLAGGIAHDFNNILSAIMGYTELAMMDVDDPKSLEKDHAEIFNGAMRAKDLIKQILTFSRKNEQQLQPLKIQLIIKEVLSLLRSSIPTTIDIKPVIDTDCHTVLADATQIHQIIMNLCTNAYHAMRDSGGILGISLDQVTLDKSDVLGKLNIQSGDYIKLEVSDSGIGMAQDIVDKIFEPYFTTKRKGEGTGLGLAVVHGTMISLDGDITVSSEQGIGTTFTAYFPVIVSSEITIPVKKILPLATGTEHILIVDDDKAITEMNKKVLEKLGYSVIAQTSSAEALELFKMSPEKFDLVITDMTMPNITGIELAQNILAIKPEIPIILCSGYSEVVDEKQARKKGISEYITKPYDNQDFVSAIRRVLDKK